MRPAMSPHRLCAPSWALLPRAALFCAGTVLTSCFADPTDPTGDPPPGAGGAGGAESLVNSACPSEYSSAGISTRCDGTCVDLSSDPDNCGKCGHTCPAESSCIQHECTLVCQEQRMACGDQCINPDNDPNHCGGCDTICQPDTVCTNGTCADRCIDSRLCDGRCVDTDNDPANCGTCGLHCDSNESCHAGLCSPLCPGSTVCEGQCVDIRNDPSNCGGCGTICPSGDSCAAGTCQPPATLVCPGTTQCGDQCVDTDVDPSNCGSCGTICPSGDSCTAGACQPPATPVCPGTTQCGDQCVDTDIDPSNCGGCGLGCSAEHVCSHGECKPTCADAVQCGALCVDTNTDRTHCGTCDTVCPSDTVCSGGLCVGSCLDATLCDGRCVNLASDQRNCGSCGNVCADAMACNGAGTCVPSCPPELVACGDTCTNLNTDATNCGSCGHACATNSVCNGSGVCTAACPADLTDCGGACVDLFNDPAACGSCDNACNLPNAVSYCASGVCQVGTCSAGYGDVDNQPGNGCECQHTADGVEICDGLDNDCDGIVDYYKSGLDLVAACSCQPTNLDFQGTPAVYSGGTLCSAAPTTCVTNPDGSVSLTTCQDCSAGTSPWASCKFAYAQDLSIFDSNADGTGVLEVHFCLSGTVGSEVALWYGVDPRRKKLILADPGTAPGCYVRYFVPTDACFSSIPNLPTQCVGQCGSVTEPCVYDYAASDILLTVAGCSIGSSTDAQISIQSITYLENGCKCSGQASCTANQSRTTCESVRTGLKVCVEGTCPGKGDPCSTVVNGSTCNTQLVCLGDTAVCPTTNCL